MSASAVDELLGEAAVALLGRPRGLLVIGGDERLVQGTAFAAALEHVNQSRACRIVTVEWPVRAWLEHGRATISQREVGVDLPAARESLARGVAHARRVDADVIGLSPVLSDVDAESLTVAAEAGILAIATFRGADGESARSAWLALYPPERRERVAERLDALDALFVAPA